MKNKQSGFIALTFVLIISAYVACIVLVSGNSETSLENMLVRTEAHYVVYFKDISCRELQALAFDIHRPVVTCP